MAMKRLITELPTLITPMKDEELMVYLSAANEAVNVGQVLADFLANTMAGYNSTSGRNPSLKVTLDSKE
ncbi:hypothetical protein Tco_0358405, partial [Tanacetum coccineum]